jgi:hypothetical protein
MIFITKRGGLLEELCYDCPFFCNNVCNSGYIVPTIFSSKIFKNLHIPL